MGISLDSHIQRYVFSYIDSNMYVLAENGEALIIDPHICTETDRYLKDNHVSKVTILLTHEHFDHICGIPWFRGHYDTKVICQQEALDPRKMKHFGRPLVVALILAERGARGKIKELETEYPSVCQFTAEQTYQEIVDMSWHEHTIHIEHIPGHSPASSLIILDGNYVFTGDSLIPDVEPTLRWPWSAEKVYYEETVPRLLRISKESLIYPGHRDKVIMGALTYKNGIFCQQINNN